MIVLGIDPGSTSIGYGIISEDSDGLKLLDYGMLRVKDEVTSEKSLKAVNEHLKNIINKYNPDEAAIEKLFFNKNIKTAMDVSESRGVILFTFEECNIRYFEYAPLQIKKTIAGYGRAVKAEIQKVLKLILDLDKVPKPDDAADALAIALCHIFHSGYRKCYDRVLKR